MTDDNVDDIEKDYNYARSRYYNLAEKSDEAIDIMMDFARESESPRAMEVLSNMLKQNAEIADRLFELQKNKKDLRKQENKKETPALTQNNVYIGTTADLQKKLIDDLKEREINPTDE